MARSSGNNSLRDGAFLFRIRVFAKQADIYRAWHQFCMQGRRGRSRIREAGPNQTWVTFYPEGE